MLYLALRCGHTPCSIPCRSLARRCKQTATTFRWVSLVRPGNSSLASLPRRRPRLRPPPGAQLPGGSPRSRVHEPCDGHGLSQRRRIPVPPRRVSPVGPPAPPHRGPGPAARVDCTGVGSGTRDTGNGLRFSDIGDLIWGCPFLVLLTCDALSRGNTLRLFRFVFSKSPFPLRHFAQIGDCLAKSSPNFTPGKGLGTKKNSQSLQKKNAVSRLVVTKNQLQQWSTDLLL